MRISSNFLKLLSKLFNQHEGKAHILQERNTKFDCEVPCYTYSLRNSTYPLKDVSKMR